jgi:hypothetical protein
MNSIYVKRNGLTNHWGIWVDPEKPITGVVSNNLIVQFISDEMYNGIDLDWESFINSDDYDPNEDYDFFESDTWLIGDWIQDSDGLWDYDPNGEYAAIVNFDSFTTQVIFSIYTKRASLCSPCYPGQADNESDGNYLAYDLPPAAYEIY